MIVKSASDAAKPYVDEKGNPVIRPYTPISPSDQPGELTFLIKRYDEGKMSKYIHELKIGDKLAIKGPIPKFEYKSMFARLPLAPSSPSRNTQSQPVRRGWYDRRRQWHVSTSSNLVISKSQR